jgi:TFIIF-interacting CTD phosphatase-like protein
MKKQYLWIVLLIPSVLSMGVLSSNNYAVGQETKQEPFTKLATKKLAEDTSDIEQQIREKVGNKTLIATIIDTTDNSTTTIVGLENYLAKSKGLSTTAEASASAEAGAPARAICIDWVWEQDVFGNWWLVEYRYFC